MDSLTVIQVPSLPGRAPYINERARRCHTEFLLIADHALDYRPVSIGALTAYANSRKDLGAVCGKVVSSRNGAIVSVGIAIGPDLMPYPLYQGFPTDHPAVKRSRRLQALRMDFVLIRSEAFSEVGGIDEEFGDLHGDVDLCLRLAELGWESHYCHDAVGHLRQAATSYQLVHTADSDDAYRRRWHNRVQSDEFQFYWEDGLVRFEQHMLYPLEIELAPPLSSVQPDEHGEHVADMLRMQSRRMLEMVKENIRMKQWCQQVSDSPVGRE